MNLPQVGGHFDAAQPQLCDPTTILWNTWGIHMPVSQAEESAKYVPADYRQHLSRFDPAQVRAKRYAYCNYDGIDINEIIRAEEIAFNNYQAQHEAYYADYYAERRANFQKFGMLVYYTEGFYIGRWKQGIHFDIPMGGIVPSTNDDSVAKISADYVVRRLSECKGMSLTLKRLIRVNVQIVAGILYYLTLEASDNNFYEAKVYDKALTEEIDVQFIRDAVHYPKIHPEILRFDAPLP